MSTRALGTFGLVAGLAFLLAGCSEPEAGPTRALPAPEGTYAPEIGPADFVAGIDNPFLPLEPGRRWVYEAQTDDGIERTEVVVLDEPCQVMGVACTAVRDTVSLEGVVVEDTVDWFAQDVDGNVWYLGEEVKNYENGVLVDTHGSWEAGVDGALPGVLMPADPQPGPAYRQEYYAGEAEDMARVVARDGAAEVPAGRFADLLVTEEWNPLDPGVKERKYYAAGVGLVLEEVVEGGEGRTELVSVVSVP